MSKCKRGAGDEMEGVGGADHKGQDPQEGWV